MISIQYLCWDLFSENNRDRKTDRETHRERAKQQWQALSVKISNVSVNVIIILIFKFLRQLIANKTYIYICTIQL